MQTDTTNSAETKRMGSLMLDGYEGRTAHPVEIVEETQKRFRIRAVTRTKLAGRNRWLEAGETALVPKYAVQESGGR